MPAVPTAPQAIAALTDLAAFVRSQLSRLGPLADSAARGPVLARQVGVDGARQFATAVVAAAAPFAPTSYSRARLIRQMHASGLLSGHELRATVALTEAVGDDATYRSADGERDAPR